MKKYSFALILGVTLLTTLVISSVLFLGKFRYRSNPLSRYIYRSYFLREVKQKKNIDPEKFWEFRDFYSTTSSVFQTHAIGTDKPFLTFDKTYFHSSDYLVNPGNEKAYLTTPPGSKILFKSPTEIIYENKDEIQIRMIHSLEEMKSANGFFSYFGIDLKPYEGFVWYNETTIKK